MRAEAEANKNQKRAKIMMLKDLCRTKSGEYALPGRHIVNRAQAMQYLQRLNAPRVRTRVLPCGAIVQWRNTPWKTRALSI